MGKGKGEETEEKGGYLLYPWLGQAVAVPVTSILRGVRGKGGNSYGGIGMGKSGLVFELGERSCLDLSLH